MRASILDQPPIAVADCHVEKVDRYDGDDSPIGTVDIVHGKKRVDERNIGFDEANKLVCANVYGLCWSESLHSWPGWNALHSLPH